MSPSGMNLARSLGQEYRRTSRRWSEEGRIGRDEITKAFAAMSAAGGRFEGMTKRQGDTVHGLWETVSDSWDMVKTKFGQIIIEETGLKDAAPRSVDGFFGRLSDNMDHYLRGGIHFMGDLVKGVAQVGYEFGKGAMQFGEIFVQQLDMIVPEARKAFDSFKQIVKDASSFKLDPVQLAIFSTNAGKALLEIGIDTIDFIARAGKSFRRLLPQPDDRSRAAALPIRYGPVLVVGQSRKPRQGRLGERKAVRLRVPERGYVG